MEHKKYKENKYNGPHHSGKANRNSYKDRHTNVRESLHHPKNSDRILFCHFNERCWNSDCRYFHCTKEDEEYYYLHGTLPSHKSSSNKKKNKPSNDNQSDVPFCKFNENCIYGPNKCRFRHSNSDKYEDKQDKSINDPSGSDRNKFDYEKCDIDIQIDQAKPGLSQYDTKIYDNLQTQKDELIALKSIFDEKIMEIDESKMTGRFIINTILPNKPFTVIFKKYDNKSRFAYDKITVEYLTPIELYFELVPEYPSNCCPAFLISCKWLNLYDLDQICEKLQSIWQESKMEILFSWYSFLQDELLQFLNYSSELTINCHSRFNFFKSMIKMTSEEMEEGQRLEKVYKPQTSRGLGRHDRRAVNSGPERKVTLEMYNDFKRREQFNKTWFACNICFGNVLGEDCVIFSCDHKSCKKCITEYFTGLIKEGNVHLLKCPESKCDTQAIPGLIRELVSDELYQRYDNLLLSSVIDSMSDIIYCPRPHCKTPVLVDENSNLACCQNCDFAFCKLCKYTFHGVSPCQMFKNLAERKEIILKYTEGDQSEKLHLEKMYGKKNLQKAVDDHMSSEWLDTNSKNCPHCKAFIEKIDGCNKMWCWKCGSYFCWLCLKVLSSLNPYDHFNDKNSKCFNLLFHGVNLDDFDIDFNLD